MTDRWWIFDLDGTLADGSHRVHYIQSAPKQWDRFNQECVHDTVIMPTACIAAALWRDGDHVAIITGRTEDVHEQTKDWLRKHFIYYNSLLMRPTGDSRPDTTVKLELYQEVMKMFDGPPLGVFEDRARMVQAWRELGLTCYQVADGDF